MKNEKMENGEIFEDVQGFGFARKILDMFHGLSLLL